MRVGMGETRRGKRADSVVLYLNLALKLLQTHDCNMEVHVCNGTEHYMYVYIYIHTYMHTHRKIDMVFVAVLLAQKI